MGEWLYYNFAAGSFHTKKLSAEKQKQKQKIAFRATLGELGQRTHSIHSSLESLWSTSYSS